MCLIHGIPARLRLCSYGDNITTTIIRGDRTKINMAVIHLTGWSQVVLSFVPSYKSRIQFQPSVTSAPLIGDKFDTLAHKFEPFTFLLVTYNTIEMEFVL